MQRWMCKLMCRLAAAGAFALPLAAAAQTAAAPEPKPAGGPPAGFVAPAEPKPDETNAQRARSQPGNNAPFWRDVRNSGDVAGASTQLPGKDGEGTTLVQQFVRYPGTQFTTAGEAWRQLRNQWLLPWGGWLMAGVAVLIALFYWRKGSLGHASNDGPRTIERFTPFERFAHWTNAITFVILAISGIVMAFGKFFLLPIIGGTLFGWLTYALKTLHNFVGPLFAISLVVVLIVFVRDELPKAGDWAWLKKGGGMLGGQEVPSHRFNAGEKVVYWIGALALGLVAVGSGLVLDKLVPGVDYTRATMQVANIVHMVSTVLMMVLIGGHIYLGTVGVKGAYQGMRTGRVDEAWAREHHELWYEDIQAGRIPAERSSGSAPGGTPAAQPKTV